MSCNNGCGCMTPKQVTDYVENLVNQMLLCGAIQGGLFACGGKTILPTGTQVVTCDQLKDLINQLIIDGEIDIPGIEDFKLVGDTLQLIDQTGHQWDVDLASLAAKGIADFQLGADGKLVITTKDGTTYDVDLADYISQVIGKAGITNGMLNQDYELVLTRGDGTQVTVDMTPLLPVVVARDGPLTGDGTEENPLDLDLTKICWQVIESITFTDEGLVIQLANQCDPIVLPLDKIINILNNKVAVCVSDQGIITGDGTEGKCLSIDLDKLVDLIINDPDIIINIATALDYKVKVAVTQGITGDGTTANPLNVKLSPDTGNLLDLRVNGLYYGTQASADVSELYIDPGAGSDSNAGNIPQAPLKTLNRAISMVREDQSSTFYLRAGQTFVLDRGMNISGGAKRTITVYGDPYQYGGALYPPNYPSVEVPYYYWEIIDAVQRPIIRGWVSYSTTSHTYAVASMNPVNGGNLFLQGIILDAKPINDVDTGHTSVPTDLDNTWRRTNTGIIYGNASGTLTMRGCKLQSPACPAGYNGSEPDLTKAPWWTPIDSSAQGDVAAVQMNHCNWPDGGNQRLIGMAAASSRLYTTGWPTNPQVITSQYPELAYNLGTKLVVNGAISGIVRDGDGKPRNISANVVL
jgi:hypothetical protein